MQNVAKITMYAILISLVFSTGIVAAHTDSGAANPMETTMRQMMGDQTFEAMEEMEHQMMGEENHAQMEKLMNKMFAGNLSQVDQQEMTRMMQDIMAGPGAMTMMMRMEMAQMMQNAGFGSGFGFGATSHWSYWITILLVWIVLILAIVALVRWLTKKPNV